MKFKKSWQITYQYNVTSTELMFSCNLGSLHFQPKPVISLHNHPLLCRPIATTVLCYQKEDEDEGGPATPAREKMEGERGHKPLKVDWETSAAYMNSEGMYY